MQVSCSLWRISWMLMTSVIQYLKQ